jgi:hypothetical protein
MLQKQEQAPKCVGATRKKKKVCEIHEAEATNILTVGSFQCPMAFMSTAS